jgi:mannosyltransferase OCH1-like enzyme/ADP-heptose:LPS heptosyltransferase
MIPKRIFYVWGANEPLKDEVKKCISTWKEQMPEFEIIQLDETCKQYFDYEKELKENKWFRTVYAKKMWAYVSDYIRIKVLYKHGGIYLDTDVSVLKNMTPLLEEPAFVGMQDVKRTEPAILGAQKGNLFLEEILKFYDKGIWSSEIFKMPDIFTKFILRTEPNFYKLPKDNIIHLKYLSIYPKEYFIPFNGTEPKDLELATGNTYTAHWYNGSWVKPEILKFLENKHKKSMKYRLKNLLSSIFSIKNEYKNGIKRKVLRFFGIKLKLPKVRKRYGYNNAEFETAKMPCLYRKSLKLFGFEFSKKTRFKVNTDPNTLKIAFHLYGGFGDILINSNFVYCFSKFINKMNNPNFVIDIFGKTNVKTPLKACLKENTFVDKIFIIEEDFNNNRKYDLIISFTSHLIFHYCNLNKIKRLCPQLFNFIQEYKTFKENTQFFATYHSNHYHIALANEKNRLQLADINGAIGVKKEFEYPVPYPDNENEILEKFGLKNKVFITLNRGIDKNASFKESTKMWSYKNYKKLVELLKNQHKDILLVQLGASLNRCRIITGIDINLVGKTSLEDIKVLIKNSFLHVDCEGGFAHLRNALKAKHPAIVIFGPTNPELYGYSSNINLYKKDVCPICCDWVIEKWQSLCLRGFDEAPCTNSITPTEVFEIIDNYIQKENI